MSDAINRAIDLSEEYDTMMEVQRNPCGAWMAIQEMAGIIAALPAVQPDAREAALREAAAMLTSGAMHGCDNPDEVLECAGAILALIDKPAAPHVNKTPKSEHDAANVLTTAAKGGDA